MKKKTGVPPYPGVGEACIYEARAFLNCSQSASYNLDEYMYQYGKLVT